MGCSREWGGLLLFRGKSVFDRTSHAKISLKKPPSLLRDLSESKFGKISRSSKVSFPLPKGLCRIQQSEQPNSWFRLVGGYLTLTRWRSGEISQSSGAVPDKK